ncbi:hypothetical protein HK100_011991 [Physocladia obscura]|uniref:Uncharacterized protein n=1 Tax=Physocladia obscura TaxID=109957 RepID=A0AAD5XDN0_9FUNG|nr:hypothetical protein HK100_011991 [Physocladia obscura]
MEQSNFFFPRVWDLGTRSAGAPDLQAVAVNPIYYPVYPDGQSAGWPVVGFLPCDSGYSDAWLVKNIQVPGTAIFNSFKEIDEFDPFKVKVARIQGVVNLPMIPRGSSLLGNTSFNVNGWYKGKQIEFFDLGLFERTKANVIELPALKEVDIMDENFNTLEMVFANETAPHSPSTFYLRYSVQGLSFFPTSYSDISSYDNISLLFDSFFFNYPPAPPPAPIVTEISTTSVKIIFSTEHQKQTSEIVKTSKILLTSEISLTIDSKTLSPSVTFTVRTAAITAPVKATTSPELTIEFLSSSIEYPKRTSATETVTKNFPASESVSKFESKSFYTPASSIEIQSSNTDTEQTQTLTSRPETEFYSKTQLFSTIESYATTFTAVAAPTSHPVYYVTELVNRPHTKATSPASISTESNSMKITNEATATFNNLQTPLSVEIKSGITNFSSMTIASESQTHSVNTWEPDTVASSSPAATRTHEIYYLTELQHVPKKNPTATKVSKTSFNNRANAQTTSALTTVPEHEIYNVTVWAPDTPNSANPTATTRWHEVYYVTKWEADTSQVNHVSTKIPVETHEVYNITVWAPDQTNMANPSATTGSHEVYYVTKWEPGSTQTAQAAPTATINNHANTLNTTGEAPVPTHEVYNVTVWAPDTSSVPKATAISHEVYNVTVWAPNTSGALPPTATAKSHEVYNVTVWSPDTTTETFDGSANVAKTHAHETYQVTKWAPNVPSTHEAFNITVWDTQIESTTTALSDHANPSSAEVSSNSRGIAPTHEVYLVSTRIRRPNAKTSATKNL